MNRSQEYSESPHIWTVCLNLSNPSDINVYGQGLEVNSNLDQSLDVFIQQKYLNHQLIKVRKQRITVYATASSIVPIYLRVKSDSLYITNVAETIIDYGELVSLNTYVLLQNLTGIPYPQNNIFNNIQLCEASGIYNISNSNIVYQGSQLSTSQEYTFDELFEFIRNQYDSYLSKSFSANILLSGGYDSRLNLALVMEAAKKYDNRINAYHFYKDENEYSITKHVADYCGITFNCKYKGDYLNESYRQIIFDRKFISFHNCNYRDDLPRWHGLLDEITNTEDNNSLIIGLGAEAHKGKYYRHINNLADAEKVLGISQNIVPEIARALKIKYYQKNSQKEFFNEIADHSQIYNRLDQQIDFMHYQTYVSNGWGGRTHDISQYYAVPFPFANGHFLKMAFTLPKSDKQDFSITKKMISRLSPELDHMKYVSGNQPSLSPKKKSYKELIPNPIFREISYLKNRYVKSTKKGRSYLHDYEHNYINSTEPRSEITKKLKTIILNDFSKIPHIRLNFTVQAYLYLYNLEKYNDNIIVLE